MVDSGRSLDSGPSKWILEVAVTESNHFGYMQMTRQTSQYLFLLVFETRDDLGSRGVMEVSTIRLEPITDYLESSFSLLKLESPPSY